MIVSFPGIPGDYIIYIAPSWDHFGCHGNQKKILVTKLQLK